MTFPPLSEVVIRTHRHLNQPRLRNYLMMIKVMGKHRNYLTIMAFLPQNRKITLSTKRILVPKSNLLVVLPKRSPI
jgi:6-phosphofructokinase